MQFVCVNVSECSLNFLIKIPGFRNRKLHVMTFFRQSRQKGDKCVKIAAKTGILPIKIKIVESVKIFYVVSVIIDAVVNDAIILPECSGRFLNFFNNDSRAPKPEIT